MFVTSIEQQKARKDCKAGYPVDADDPCSPATADTCCLVEVGDDCLANDLFVEYSLCFIEESSGGAGCPASLSCGNIKLTSTEESSAAGCLASPLRGVGSFLVGMVLALVLCVP